jgi:nitronate monooxygenase
VPQVVDAVKVPVVAAGGIADARHRRRLRAGAAGVQIGTAICTVRSKISAPHRAALRASQDNGTTLTNVMSGRPARGIVNRLIREVGPISKEAPAFPLAANAIAPLRAAAEKQGSGDFSPLWSGQAAALGRAMPAGELTKRLAAEALENCARFQSLIRHGRACPGHPRLIALELLKTWTPGTSPGVTEKSDGVGASNCRLL